jgi:hypothetical protein
MSRSVEVTSVNLTARALWEGEMVKALEMGTMKGAEDDRLILCRNATADW